MGRLNPSQKYSSPSIFQLIEKSVSPFIIFQDKVTGSPRLTGAGAVISVVRFVSTIERDRHNTMTGMWAIFHTVNRIVW